MQNRGGITVTVALNFVKQTQDWLIYITILHYGD